MTFRAFSKRSPVNLFPVGRSHLSQDAMRRTGDTFLPAPALPSEPPTETRDRRAARARRRGRIQYKQKPQVTASES
ncbi:hypothetical protein IQ62_33570 [Streptomyces scabiei]|nr:hypothetical protein IQ62_33570 [Streptomyces scabiei]